MARARVAAERTIARIAAHAVAVHPAGFATLDSALLDAVDRETGTRLIGNLVTCIGGQVYAPRGTQLSRLAGRLMDGDLGGGATLGGCILRSDGRGMVRIVREQAAIEAPRSVDIARDSGRAFFWDGRFHVSVPTTGRAGMTASSDGEIQLGAVGSFTARGVPLRFQAWRHTWLAFFTAHQDWRGLVAWVRALPVNASGAAVDSQGRGPLDLTYLETRALPYLTPVCAEVRARGSQGAAGLPKTHPKHRKHCLLYTSPSPRDS